MSISTEQWFPNTVEFLNWLHHRESLLSPALPPKPSVKTLIFLALLDSPNAFCTYQDIESIIRAKNAITGTIPQTSLRTSLLSLKKILETSQHPYQLLTLGRGCFKLELQMPEKISLTASSHVFPQHQKKHNTLSLPILLLADGLVDHVAQEKEIAYSIIQKTTIPYKALYMREWSARMWGYYSYATIEGNNRFNLEWNSWEKLNIKKRLLKKETTKETLCVVGIAVGEGVSEIGLLQNIFLDESIKTVHYLAVDSSPRFLRDHIALMRETFIRELREGKLICVGVLSDALTHLSEAVDIAKAELQNAGHIEHIDDFLPVTSGMLVTYFGNCLGNHPGQEIEFFSSIKSCFKHRPLEILLGVSIIGAKQDQYERDFDNFLMQIPRYFLDIAKIFESSMDKNNELPEFVLSQKKNNKERYTEMRPEPYIVHHGIKGDIYRFYYKLNFDLRMAPDFDKHCPVLKKGTSILLINVIKYDIQSLIEGIEKGLHFKTEYHAKHNIFLKEEVKERDYTILSVYLGE